MSTGNWITVGIFAFTWVVAAASAYYGFVRSMERRVSKLENRCESHQSVIDSIATLNTRLDKITNDNEMFWKILGPHLAGIIHSPKSVDRDILVDKLVHETINVHEAQQLVCLIDEALKSGRWSADKRLAGALLMARAQSTVNRMKRGA